MRKGLIKRLLSILLLLPVMATACVFPSVSAAEDDPIIYYNFDGGNVDDQSGNGNDAAPYGTLKQVAGVSGDAMYFSGGYVQLPSMDFTDKTAFSVSVWTCTLQQEQQHYTRVFSFGKEDGRYLFDLVTQNNGNYLPLFRVNGANITGTMETPVSYSTWSHLVYTCVDEGNGGKVTLYKDGVEVSSGTTEYKLAQLGTVPGTLGRAPVINITDYFGYMDEFKVYDRALSADEIAGMTEAGTKSLLDNTLENLSIANANGLDNLDAVMQDLTMPAAADIGVSGAQISWQSSNPDVFSETGVIGAVSEATEVTLTATVARGEVSAQTDYTLTVVPKGEIKADPVEITTAIGVRPNLPERITANGGTASAIVTWDLPAESEFATMYAGVGTFTVDGTTDAGEAITASVTVAEDLYTNPLILPPSPDPYITYKDGYYYYIKSSGGINIAKSRRLQDIGSAELVCVFNASGSGYSEFWAPELHYVDGCWYIYVAPVPSGTGRRRMVALKSTDPDNAQAPYELVGEMGPTIYNEETGKWEINPDSSQNLYALDGTVVEAGGKKYFIYSAHLGTGGQPTTQDIYINEMYDATTLMGDRVKLPAGGARFEKMDNIGNHIAEGPQILKRNGKVYVFYSTDRSNTDWYQVCVMYADENSDLLNPDNWTKHPGPLLTKSLDTNDEIFAPGHACVVTSPDGKEDWLIYHAYSAHNASDRTGAQEARCARAIKIGWDGDIPVMGYAQPLDALIDAPTGEGNSVALKMEGESGVLSGGASVVSGLSRASEHAVAGNITGSATATYKFNITTPGKYLITVQGCAMQSGTSYQDITVNGEKTTLRYRVNYSGAYRFMPSCTTDGEMVGEGLYVDLPAGETTIVLSANAQSAGAVAVDYIYLLNEDVPQASKIELDVEELELTEGQSTKLNATVTPESEMTITWTSSDESVVTVDENGNVTAVGEGTAEITATLPDGGTVTCPVTVTAPAPTFVPGDVDKSGTVDVADIMKLKALIMADKWSDEELLIGDLDDSKKLDVGDIMAVKNIIMSK